MGKDNNSNPFSRDKAHTQRDVPLPLQKARVVSAKPQSANAFHTVRVQVYGDQSTFVAPVIMPMPGCTWIPEEGTDVAVLFAAENKPWVVGSWYALDRVESGDVDLPEYEPGDIRLGNESGSHVTVEKDGSIDVVTDGRQTVDIDHQSASTYMGSDQSIAGDNAYDILAFDTENYDPESLFDTATHSFTLRAGGNYIISAGCEIGSAGQQNRYTIGIFVDGSLRKRRTTQSSTNAPMSISLRLEGAFDGGEEIDVRLKQDSGSTKTVQGGRVTTDFNISRQGI